MLFDIQEQRIYAYEYYGFESELNPGNQTMLEEQYEEASELDSFVVFVRDNDERRLVSYVVGSDCPAPKPKKKRRKRER